jgi:hypothetical protein
MKEYIFSLQPVDEIDNIPSCLNCFHCKTLKGSVYCKIGYFNESNIKKALLYTPFEFDCDDFESMD